MKRTALISALLLGTLALAGCTASGGADLALPGSADDSAGSEVAPDSGGLSREESSAEQQVITTGWATVTVDEPAEAARELASIVERAGGRVESRQEYAAVDGDSGSASLTLRIPADALTATLEKLDDLGEVRELSTTEEDVTTDLVDLEARITALEASVDRLVALLAGAADTSTLLEIESTLSARQADLESLQSQKRYLDEQVDLSTVTVSLVSAADSPADEPDTFLTGLETGWASFVGFLAGLLVLLGVLLPWIVFLAVLGGVVMLVVRARRRRGRPAGGPDVTDAQG